MPTYSRRRAEYFLIIIDDYSKKVTAYPVQHKSKMFDCFLRFQKRNKRFFGKKVIVIRMDNDKEFLNHRFNAHLECEGIKHEKMNPSAHPFCSGE